ncbi:MAG: outer membrane beta-barrel protein [Prevotella sp.]|nr:outer membrane beta-barrel protein [Prevotella sp.]
MRKILFLVLACAFVFNVGAQRITHDFRNVSMSDALKYIQAQSTHYNIVFIYNELEDFKVTASVRNKRVGDAIQQLIGFYPILMTVGENNDIYVECVQKTERKYIGRLVNRSNSPIEFANVALLNPGDSSFVTGGVTNSDGLFVIPCDVQPVLARLSFVGYRTAYVRLEQSRVGTIRLYEDTQRLKEVKVTTLRPTVTYRGDRYSVHIGNTLLGVGNTAESLLTQLPGVWMNGSDLSINGISGAQVMVDDRNIDLSGSELVAYLKGIRSETIDKIEIIPNPSAEFAAQGMGGVLRILTKERQGGSQLVVGTSVDFINYKALRPYVSYGYGKGKFGFDFSANGTFGKGYLRMDALTKNKERLVNYQNNVIDRMDDVMGTVNSNIYYDFNARNKLALNLNYSHWYKDEHVDGYTLVDGEGAPETVRTDSRHETVQNQNTLSASLNFTHKFGCDNRNKLLVLADVTKSFYPNDDEFEYNNYDRNGNLLSTENLRHHQSIPFFILSGETRAQWDFLKHGSLMAGMKCSRAVKENEFMEQTLVNGAWSGNVGHGYSFKYAEDLQAAYLKYDLSGKKWNLTAGLRGEYNYAKADGYDFSYHHFDLFPSLYYTCRMSKWHTLIFSISRRTQRVGFGRLMPYRYYHSRYMLKTGNPDLRPDYSNHINVTCQLAQKYNLTFTHVWSNNGLDNYNRTEFVDGQAMSVASFVDGVKSRLTNLNLYAPVSVASWWLIVNQARVSFDKYITSETSVNNFDWKIYMQHTFVLPQDIRMQLLYRYISESKSAYGKSRDYHQLDFSCMKTFLNDKLTCKLSVNDLICGQKNWSYTQTNNVYHKTYRYDRRVPFFSFSIYYTFTKGKRKQHDSIEQSNSDEKRRAM